MISTHIPGFASIVRVHLERGEINGEHPVALVSLVAEYTTPTPLRDDLGFVTFTQMCMTAYSEN
jgi:hypothetical protein